MKNVSVVAALFLLAGCASTEADQQEDLNEVQDSLPPGCQVSYLGDVRIADSNRKANVFVTRCGETTTTTSTLYINVPTGQNNQQVRKVQLTTVNISGNPV